MRTGGGVRATLAPTGRTGAFKTTLVLVLLKEQVPFKLLVLVVQAEQVPLKLLVLVLLKEQVPFLRP